MFKEFQGKTLEEAYEKASTSLKCSVTDLEIDIIQAPSKGFLGFFTKDAIINVTQNTNTNKTNHKQKKEKKKNSERVEEVETLSSKLNALNSEVKTKKEVVKSTKTKQIKKEKIFDDFYEKDKQKLHESPTVNPNNEALIKEIKTEVSNLFSKLCYEIDEIKVDILDDSKTVYIEFGGTDSALLIGKEGYRYKALSYILFNWINEKYNMMLRLEIAEFLVNQEDAIYTYLEPVIETINHEGFYKTKILDGILIHIALTKLRDEFPDKYVAVKTTQRGDKYILVNEYKK
ncbi:MAG: Jag N-terminal domain-containing protein [Campylobacterota bacterium]|nr:Jag N-terminal domain-containing protein [Campylobacterota bacterium]